MAQCTEFQFTEQRIRSLGAQEKIAVSNELLKSKHLSKYWSLVGLYGLVAGLFLSVADKANSRLEYWLLGALIVGPAFAYPVAFYLNSTDEERKYVRQLSEMWAPVWAALSLLWVAISKGAL